jgi:hypothetical protein
MEFNKNRKRLINLLIIPVICMLYLHFLYIKWDSFDELLSIILPYVLFGLAIGIIISTLPYKKPILTTFISTVPVPLICYVFEIIFVSILNNPAFAGGPGGSAELGFGFTLVLMAFGGIPLGIFAVIGCIIGIEFKKKLTGLIKVNLKNKDNQYNDVNILSAKISSRATVIVGIITALTSLIVSLIK